MACGGPVGRRAEAKLHEGVLTEVNSSVVRIKQIYSCSEDYYKLFFFPREVWDTAFLCSRERIIIIMQIHGRTGTGRRGRSA